MTSRSTSVTSPSCNALLAGLADKASPYFHDFLTPAQFDAAFGPTTAQVDAIDAALRAAGLSPGQASADHLSIPVAATAGQLDHAFGMTLDSYRLPGSQVAYANASAPKISSAVAPLVQGVIGLNDLYPAQPAASRASAGKATAAAKPLGRAGPAIPTAAAATGPQPCTAAVDNAGAEGVATLDQVADYYGLNELYALGDLGAGARIALLELEPTVTGDVATFERCYGLSTTAVHYITVDQPPATDSGDPGSAEASLDIDIAQALAPKAAVDVYQAPNSQGAGPGTGMYDIFHAFVTSDTDKVMSVSWGTCEADSDLSDVQAQETLFAKANAQGQTILAAAGDSGSSGCFQTGGPTDPALSVNTPASSPYVISVGGTEATTSGQAVWNFSDEDDDAGGGGISGTIPEAPGSSSTAGWCMPGYQHQTAIPGIINANSVPASGCSTGYFREVPDVSAYAAGYGIYVSEAGGWSGLVGTSAATPVWASIAALTNVSPFCSGYGSGNVGVLPQALYAAVASAHSYIYSDPTPEALSDITIGDNDYTPSGYGGGRYPAGPGFDEASGLGAPLASGISGDEYSTYYPGYAALICRSMATRKLKVTSLSSNAGKAGAPTRVTIRGTGFLAVPGADRVREYQGSKILTTLTPSCTTTACTVTLPKETARTVDLEVSVEDSAYTKGIAFTYANAPHISSISPSRGTHNGGTKVTIKGSNFIHVASVKFNGKAATRLSVSGTGAITVYTPKGTKGTRIKVVVSAAGGTSNYVLYTYT